MFDVGLGLRCGGGQSLSIVVSANNAKQKPVKPEALLTPVEPHICTKPAFIHCLDMISVGMLDAAALNMNPFSNISVCNGNARADDRKFMSLASLGYHPF